MYHCYLYDERDAVMDVWPIDCDNDREAEESAVDIQAACSAAATEVWRGGRLVYSSAIQARTD